MTEKENIFCPPHVLRNNSHLAGLEAYQRHIKLLYLHARKAPWNIDYSEGPGLKAQ
ncbi:MAG TPA: hypothetical protein VGH51_14420 [Candidatus Angelobacter sp.]|jgi:hypothetical protein